MATLREPLIPFLTLRWQGEPARRAVKVERFPFSIGRASDAGLVLPESYVSREHASIVHEGSRSVLLDASSRHGTFVNGQRVRRHVLEARDCLQFGSVQGPALVVSFEEAADHTQHTILEQLRGLDTQQTDIEKLRWFMQAALALSTAVKVDRVLASLLETTLALAQVERGFVFLADRAGRMELALGMDAHGQLLTDTSSVSRTVMEQAAAGEEQFIVTDTLTAEGSVPMSMVAHSIRTVVCIPLRRVRRGRATHTSDPVSQVFGLLYLDSHFTPDRMSDLDHGLIGTIAREAAALVDNAQLIVVEDEARQHEQELQIAADIQKGLMAVRIPRFPFAEVQAHSLPCSAVGGDFFDVISSDDSLAVAVVDVSGKGMSAAILAATLQGMLHVQLQSGRPLDEIAASTNQYLCAKSVGKYATMVLLRLYKDGRLEYMNCGHIHPRVWSGAGNGVERLDAACLPVGLLCEAQFSVAEARLSPRSRVIVVSDGVTEAEDASGDFFGDTRLDSVAHHSDVESVLNSVQVFAAGVPATDDCTVVQVTFTGRA